MIKKIQFSRRLVSSLLVVCWHLWEANADWEDGCGEQRGVEQPGPGVPVQQVAQVYPLDGPRPQGDVQDGDLQNEYKWLFVR